MEEPLYRRRGFLIGLAVLLAAVVFVVSFSGELQLVLGYLAGWVRLGLNLYESLLTGRPVDTTPPAFDTPTRYAFLIVGYVGVVFYALFNFTLFVLARFVLPVQTDDEQHRVHQRLWRYIMGTHGAAVFVKNGRLVASQAEKKELIAHHYYLAGIALVDPASALALEYEYPMEHSATGLPRRGGLDASLYRLEKRMWKSRQPGAAILASGLCWLRWLRVRPGRAWHRWQLEQHRIRPRRLLKTTRVEGPGIVFIEPGERVRGTLDLRRQIRNRLGIKALTRDGIEVETSIAIIFRLDDRVPEAPAADGHNRPPFEFNRESAFRAVYGTPVYKSASTSENEEEKKVRDWTDLPAFVASDIFRDMLSTQTLDNLFRPTSDNEFPLNAFRTAFDQRVQQEPVLLERGIRVTNADISLLTVPNEVAQQRIRSWQSDWIRHSIETLAGGDLETARIIQRARANAQYDMTKQMTTILQDSVSNAAVVLRLFQALEAASSDPSTRALLPNETADLLKSWIAHYRSWLKPGGEGTSGRQA